jgi:hypothetical protein
MKNLQEGRKAVGIRTPITEETTSYFVGPL